MSFGSDPDPAQPSDAELVRQARGGAIEAYGALVQRCNQRLYRVARAIVRDDAEAEDVLQEAYVRAFAALADVRDETHVGSWLTRIVINEARGRLRRRRPMVGLGELDAATGGDARLLQFPTAAPAADPERAAAAAEMRRLLEGAIDQLPAAFRLVFVLRDVQGLSVEDTAAELGLRPETVRTRLHRAHLRMRRLLDETLASALQGSFPFLGERCARMRAAVLVRVQGAADSSRST